MRRALGGGFSTGERFSLSEGEAAHVEEIEGLADPTLIEEALAALKPAEVRRLARGMLWKRAGEAIEILRSCGPCRELLSGGGYDPIELLEALRNSIGQRDARMDIDVSGGGGSQRGQGFETEIRFGPNNFLSGIALDGMSVRESQLQVILHELAHAAGDVIPPDGGSATESVRNQHRITRACLPETYRRIMAGKEPEPGL